MRDEWRTMNDEHPNVTNVCFNHILLMVMMTIDAFVCGYTQPLRTHPTVGHTTATWKMSDIAAGEEHSGFEVRTMMMMMAVARTRTKTRASSMGMLRLLDWTKTNNRLMCSLKLVSIVLWFSGLQWNLLRLFPLPQRNVVLLTSLVRRGIVLQGDGRESA